ncbi:MAG TPA: hypothetical protein VN752_10085 [Solirubrobacterales bacterium]|nr:hypothetical protein [Solirubrobacterales bacterium]
MEEAPGIDFRPTAAQRRILEGGPRVIGGRSGGRRYATEMFIVATAANEHEAKLALEDLHTKGIAALTDEGKRIDPTARRRRFAVVKFDEEPRRTAPCPDCDGAGCEHCGGTGRRWVS